MNKILHIGIGNFHRAHQAWYTHQANQLEAQQWQVIGVSLRSPRMRDQLASQNFNYNLIIQDDVSEEVQSITVIEDILVQSDDGEKILDFLADETIKIISITVTEKAYHLNGDGELDLNAEAIQADLKSKNPKTLVGLLAHGLHIRQKSNHPITILSCDNLPENGVKLEKAIRKYCIEKAFDITSFLDQKTSFPNTMVDRITPATDPLLIEKMSGSENPNAPVATETFSEWVIENKFVNDVPNWHKVGVKLTDDVAPFEMRKLRMLNGAHSYIAYKGILKGYEFVHQAIADDEIYQVTSMIMDEAAQTLTGEVLHDIDLYKAALLKRFANPNLDHKLRQIAMDGSLKMPIRILSTYQERQIGKKESPGCEAALEAWVSFIKNEFSADRALDDPNDDMLRIRLQKLSNNEPLEQALNLLNASHS